MNIYNISIGTINILFNNNVNNIDRAMKYQIGIQIHGGFFVNTMKVCMLDCCLFIMSCDGA